MKLVCAFCGFRNKPEATNCVQCGQSLADAAREKFHLPWAAWVPAIPIVALFFYFDSIRRGDLERHYDQMQELASAHSKALRQLTERFAKEEVELVAKHKSLLSDPEFISGRAAAKRHETEWTQRLAHNPKYISSILEKTLVEVERVGKDPNLNSETALKKVAELVCPPGSRIEVTPSGSRFVVRVAFRLSAVAPMEAGTLTLHHSSEEMRHQVEDATARVIAALFDYCGSRGIERISVSCNRALVERDNGADRLAMRSLYRASINATKASEVARWRELSIVQIKKLFQVEKDMLSRITFKDSSLPTLALDPNEPLEF